MSVKTTADEKLDACSFHINEAVQDLKEVLVEECWGHDQYRKEYREMLDRMFMDLMRMKKKLNR